MIRHHGEHAAKQVFEPTAREVIDADQLSDKGDTTITCEALETATMVSPKMTARTCAGWASNKS